MPCTAPPCDVTAWSSGRHPSQQLASVMFGAPNALTGVPLIAHTTPPLRQTIAGAWPVVSLNRSHSGWPVVPSWHCAMEIHAPEMCLPACQSAHICL
jgi:hypothetical protein